MLVLVWHRENAAAEWKLVLGCVVAPKKAENPDWAAEDDRRATYANMVYETEDGGLLNELGIPYDPIDGFAAALYRGRDGVYYLVFRGTEPNLRDYGTDLRQAYSLSTSQYNQSISLARLVHDVIKGKVVFIGHSLSGGLASAAAYATHGQATTYNAAGLSYKYQQGSPGSIKAHYIVGEILSTGQDTSIFPSAAGTRIPHDIPIITPSIGGVPMSYAFESVERHSMNNFVLVH